MTVRPMTSSESPTSGNRLMRTPPWTPPSALAMVLVPVMVLAALMRVFSGWFAGVAGCAPLLTTPHATDLVLLLAVSPVLEEYLLRQAVHQSLIGAALGGPGSRSLLAAAVFAALHLARGLAMPALVFVPALLNGWLFERTRRWQLCAAAHAVANGTALLACNA